MSTRKTCALRVTLALAAASCAPDAPAPPPEPVPFRTGAQVLAYGGFAPLRGKRVGLIANHTSMVGGRHLADLLREAEGVQLLKLFAPEHGIRGTADAGAIVATETDPVTGLVVHSLHGDTLKPTPEMLGDLDVLAFDLQDVGTRFYTYISTLGLAMQAAAEAGVTFMVLDRPNPLGGNMVEGFTLEMENRSFIGMYRIPGMATSPRLQDREVHGIRHVVTDAQAVRPVEAGVNVLHAFWHQAPDSLKATFFVDVPFRQVTGTARLYRMIMEGRTPAEIVAAWQPDVSAFLEMRRKHLLYE